MITQDKIKIYKRYKGDIDRWARSSLKKEKSIMEDRDWYIIDDLIQDLYLARNELVSLTFRNDFNNKLVENCESEEAIQILKEMTD
ncbi:MAG: hypothetical protein JNM22_17630 [Saprospiraceae bacterium]|nr:hypothetical protein [Saprospiraceae bacterium]